MMPASVPSPDVMHGSSKATPLEQHDQVFSTVVGSYPNVLELKPEGKTFLDATKKSLEERNTYGRHRLLTDHFDHLTAHAVIDQLLIQQEVKAAERSGDSHNEKSRSAIDDTTTKFVGIDVIGTGQPSITSYGNMNVPFYQLIDGITVERTSDGVYNSQIDRRIRFDESAVTNDEPVYALREYEIADELIECFVNTPGYGDRRIRPPKLKLAITGPATLSSGIQQGNRNKVDTAMDLADVLFELIRFMKEGDQNLLRHVHHIQIDEPILTQVDFVHYVQLAAGSTLQLIKRLHEKLKIPVSLHMCGPFEAGHLSLFEDAPLYAIDLEVAYSLSESTDERRRGRSPIEELEKSVERLPQIKRWGLGLVNSASYRVENPEEIRTLKSRLTKVVDESRLLLSPDCGMRGLKTDAARQKLANMLMVAEEHRRDLKAEAVKTSQKTQKNVSRTAFTSDKAPEVYGHLCKPVLGTTQEAKHILEIQREIDIHLGFLHSGAFQFFSVHDHKHSRRVIYYVNQILGRLAPELDDDTLRVLWASCYGHDVGLFHSGNLKNVLWGDGDPSIAETSEGGDDSVRDVRSVYKGSEVKELEQHIDLDNGNVRTGKKKQVWALSTIIRKVHGFRSGRFFNTRIAGLAGHEDGQAARMSPANLRACIEIVNSHQSSSVLPEDKPYKPDSDYSLRFLAALLRIADECDMSRERLPPDDLRDEVRSLVDKGESGKTKQEFAEAVASQREYDKMAQIEFVHIDHFSKSIRIFHSPEIQKESPEWKLVDKVRDHIEKNLSPETIAVFKRYGIELENVTIEPTRPDGQYE